MKAHRASTSVVTTLTLLSSFVGLTANATVIAPQDYKFPYTNPYESTLISGILKGGKNYSPNKATLTHLVPHRDSVPYLEGRDQLDYEFNIVSPHAPLVFILAGIGGAANSGASEFLADRLGREGFSTICLASPYYWRFALVASKTGVPGVVSQDAEELYGEMKMLLAQLKETQNIQPRKLGFVGYSMGAFEGVTIAKIDHEQNDLGISSFMLINPPMDLVYGIQVLDGMYDQALQLGSDTITNYFNILENNGEVLLAGDIDQPGYFENLVNRLGLPVAGAKYLVSEAIESSAPDLVMTSQSINQTLPSSEFPVPTNSTNRSIRESIASQFLLGDYMKKIVVPTYAKSLSLQADSDEFKAALLKETSLKPHLTEIAADPRIHFMHNADDFITAPADLRLLEQAVPSDRIVVYPFGGHVENVWFPQNLQHIMDTFKKDL